MTQHYQKQLLAPSTTAGNIGGWKERHIAAMACPRTEYEKALVELLSGWLRYADAVQERWESGIGNDYVLGRHWAEIAAGIRGLLNGDLGRLDAGSLDGLLCRTLEAEGLDPNSL